MEDLSDPSHLATLGPADPAITCDSHGPKLRLRDFLKVSFANVRSLVEAREELNRLARQNAASDVREKERGRFGGRENSGRHRQEISDGAVEDSLNFGQEAISEGVRGGGKGTRPEDSTADLLRLVEALFEADVLYIARSVS